ncbi:spore cortex biosynthesis protein YabQ [Paenibacillus allorhizosphaerae]|uniref:Spore protein YabQ n=1 Tax=Paenibacillus allorhizosphaerae TaxID=2849866 RepID=A0ABM8VSC7_9BACL|nr:spore cortex biosynthesis protein YabQ [Paenibacillus allorhizosphaerae]CAG7656353.1 Spore protein YabQ [Paenibacillus allorhizosphaerae]
MTLQIQFVTMGMMYAGGLALGGLFDVYRVLSGQLRVPLWLKAVLDLLYWFVGTIIVFKLLYESNWGEVRFYIFVGLIAGILFYFWLFSRPVIRVIQFMIRMVLATIRIGKRMIELFIIKPVIMLYRLIVIILGFLCATAIFLYKIMLQLCYPVWKLLLWMVRPLGRYIRIPVPDWVKKLGRSIAAWIRRLF